MRVRFVAAVLTPEAAVYMNTVKFAAVVQLVPPSVEQPAVRLRPGALYAPHPPPKSERGALHIATSPGNTQVDAVE